MDCRVSYNKPFLFQSLASTGKAVKPSSFSSRHTLFLTTLNFSDDRLLLRPLTHAARSCSRRSPSFQCEFSSSSSLYAPLEPRSPAGKFLSSVLLNDRECFHNAVAKQLEQLVRERDEAVARMNLSLGSGEASLHRRIAKLKEHECQTAVEDVMYMLIFYKFSEIKVHLVPRLSKCIYQGRLEICSSKDWELEYIHSLEVLEMIREHLTTVVGWRPDSNVTYNWAPTEIQRMQLCRVYAASILYGYFLKSASLRHYLELNLAKTNCDLSISSGTSLPHSEPWSYQLKNTALGHVSSIQSVKASERSCNQGKDHGKLRCYVMGFDLEMVQMCAKPKSKEAANLIEKHSSALFGDEKTGLLENDEVISTSLASLKRFVLEAVAFGSFLWDAEDYVNAVYKLKEN